MIFFKQKIKLLENENSLVARPYGPFSVIEFRVNMEFKRKDTRCKDAKKQIFDSSLSLMTESFMSEGKSVQIRLDACC